MLDRHNKKTIKVNGSLPRRNSQACDRCRSKKIRCDGALPCCSSCASVNFDCKTSDVLSRRAFPKNYTQYLEKSVRALETQNEDLRKLLDERKDDIDVMSQMLLQLLNPSSHQTEEHRPSPSARSETAPEDLEMMPCRSKSTTNLEELDAPQTTGSLCGKIFIEVFKHAMVESGTTDLDVNLECSRFGQLLQQLASGSASRASKDNQQVIHTTLGILNKLGASGTEYMAPRRSMSAAEWQQVQRRRQEYLGDVSARDSMDIIKETPTSLHGSDTSSCADGNQSSNQSPLTDATRYTSDNINFGEAMFDTPADSTIPRSSQKSLVNLDFLPLGSGERKVSSATNMSELSSMTFASVDTAPWLDHASDGPSSSTHDGQFDTELMSNLAAFDAADACRAVWQDEPWIFGQACEDGAR